MMSRTVLVHPPLVTCLCPDCRVWVGIQVPRHIMEWDWAFERIRTTVREEARRC